MSTTVHFIYLNNDSVNEDEFEGFDPEDIYIDLNNENGRTDLFDSEKWGVGSRQDQEPLFSKYCSAYRFVSVAISSMSSSLINILK
jgi:hypothetical protein